MAAQSQGKLVDLGVEPKIGGKPPKSYILIGFSIINHYKPSILGIFPLFLVQHPSFYKHSIQLMKIVFDAPNATISAPLNRQAAIATHEATISAQCK